MKIGHTIDSQGFLTGDVLDGSDVDPTVTLICPDGFYKPKWNGSEWIEGLTQAEIDVLKDAPPEKTTEQKTIDKLTTDNELLNLKIIDLWETLLNAGVL